MSSTVAESPIAVALAQLRLMIALSSTFRNGGGSIDSVFATEEAFITPRPWAIVAPGERMGWRLIAGGAQNWLRPEGSLFLLMSIDTPEDFFSDQVAAEIWAANYFGGIMNDIASVSAADSPDGEPLLAINNLDLSYMSENHEKEHAEAGRFYLAGVNVDWGDG